MFCHHRDQVVHAFLGHFLQGFYSRKLDAVRLEQIEDALGVNYPTTTD